ncbi:MAG: glycosyltransferase family 2 protein [Firmicutes bacterium]|nr:glycosyltransferase family 2 protein [Bacillota bacterium]
MDKLNIVVPCYNESDMLEKFYSEIKKVINELKNVECKIIFIDDGSKDNTLEIIKKLSSEDEKVKYISFSRNFGKEAAIYAGLEACKKIGGLGVLLDADLQDPPNLILKMFDEIKNNDFDMVVARRISRTGESKLRSFLSDKFYDVMNNFSSVKLKNGTRDFRMMKDYVIEAVLNLKEKNRFSKGLFPWVGFKTKYLDYENITRQKGVTKWSLRKLFLYAFEGLIAFSVLPLTIIFFSSVIIFLISFLIFVLYLVRIIFFHVRFDELSFLLHMFLFVNSLLFLSIGILSCYVSKIYSEIKNRVIYITREKNI